MRSPIGRAPKFMNPFGIRFPIGAISPTGHQIPGALLLLSLPLLALVLKCSLRSEAAYESFRMTAATAWWGLLLVILAAGAAHHALSGVSHLMMDVGIGNPHAQARVGA